jgi:hypothetical protein
MAALALAGHYNVSVTDKLCSWQEKKNLDKNVKTLSQIYLPSRQHHFHWKKHE